MTNSLDDLDFNHCYPHPITLKFPIASIEESFNLSYRKQAVAYYKLIAIYIIATMVTLSITGVFIDFSVNTENIQKLLWLSYIPVTALTIGLLYCRQLSNHPQHIVVSYVIISGIIGIIFPRIQTAEFAMLYGHSYIMLVCFLLFPLSRIRISYGILISFILIILFTVVIGTMPNYLIEELPKQCGWIIGATLFGLSIGYLIELNFRRWFLARKIIENREIQLKQEHEKLLINQQLLLKEKELADTLLLSILPKSIVNRLKVEGKSIADGIVECTVLFSDLVGFTTLAQEIGPLALVSLLNDIFSAFDELSAKYKLEKIKTIGDAYMVAGGVPNYCPNHAALIASMALDMRQFIDSYNKEKNLNLGIRIGIHTGPVIAGIIGTKKFSYDLWGDAVNLASRMESHAISGKIQVTEATYLLLKKDFYLEERGMVNIKGKGEMKTYFLEKSYSVNL